MTFSAFDKRLLEEGPAFFARPTLRSLLERLGTTRAERMATLTAILETSCLRDLDEAAGLFERRLVRAAQRQLRETDARGK